MLVIIQTLWLIFYFIIQADATYFYESFNETLDGRWIVSAKDGYKGLWKVWKSDGHEDYGLLVSEKARKYGIVKELDEVLEIGDKEIVLQYDVRFHNGLRCGGAYLKFLHPQETGWKPHDFDGDTPYSIMFGPDKCAFTDKVHFIFKHQNPNTGNYTLHHLLRPPTFLPDDQLSHVYTAILYKDNRLRILIDGKQRRKANFFSPDDFDPPLLPPKSIFDPQDMKPDEWDERPKIADPSAVKPDDWDVNAPQEIEDEGAVKPPGWLDNEPDEIDDPDASKPEDWDDDEDGEWEAPRIENPKCVVAPGCGEWKRPMKKNPSYKGEWLAPLIDNPNYKGLWKPKLIPNPDYFPLKRPNFEPIAAVAIEIWTMQDGILFDNILIASSEDEARAYRDRTWKRKFKAEKKKLKEEQGHTASSDFLFRIQQLIKRGEKQPPLTLCIVFAILIIKLIILFRIFFGREEVEPELYVSDHYMDMDASDDEGSNRTENQDSFQIPRTENQDAFQKNNALGPARRRLRIEERMRD